MAKDVKARYAIVRVEHKCPAYEDYICERIDKRWRIVDTSVDCNKCKIRKKYGDTKEQLIRKIAQVMLRRFKRFYKGKFITVEMAEKQYLEVAKEIVEFLGVE